MNRAWIASLSEIWHSSNFPMWLTIIAAVLFAVILVITMMRAEKSAANGALIVIALLAVGIAAIAMMRSSSVAGAANDASRSGFALQPSAGLPALACLDGLAGENVETACEKAVFASVDSTAAAVSYAASQVSRLASYGNVAAADKVMTPELQALRRSVERDRYGLIAQVLTARDGCNLSVCPFFQSLTNTAQISVNMTEKTYEGFIAQYLPLWNAPPLAAAPATTSALAPNVPSGKVLTGDFPASSTSIPPVNIMTPEPASPPPSATPKTAEEGVRTGTPPAAAKKPPAQKPRAQAPASLAPPPASDDN